jgi:hypothetical protein
VSADDQAPYYVYGGMQDTGHWTGPSRTYDNEGITNHDWIKLRYNGDGMAVQPERGDPNVIYMVQEYGNTSRLDLRQRKEAGARSEDLEGDQGLVVGGGQVRGVAAEGVADVEDHVLGLAIAGGDGGFEAVKVEEFAAGVLGLGDAVGVEQQGLAGLEGERGVVELLAGIDPQGQLAHGIEGKAAAVGGAGSSGAGSPGDAVVQGDAAQPIAKPAAPAFVPSDLPRLDVHTHVEPGALARAKSLLGRHGTRHFINLSGGEAMQRLIEQGPPITSPTVPGASARKADQPLPPPSAGEAKFLAPPPSLQSQSKSQIKHKLLPEGHYIADRRGRLICSSDYWLFVFESDGKVLADPPIKVLPNRWLEKMESDVAASHDPILFRISGEITTYRGQNFLLLRKVLIEREPMDNVR